MVKKYLKRIHAKTKPPLLIALAVVSLLGFLVIIFNELGIYDLAPLTSHLMFVILGVGLAFEGNIIGLWKFLTKGAKFRDVSTKTITVIIGIAAIVIGLLGLIRFDSVMLNSFRLLIAIIASAAIVLETWFVK